MYAEGLHRSFHMVKSLNLPIYVTENGVADDDDDLRPEHIRRHSWLTSKAIEEGLKYADSTIGVYEQFRVAEGYTQRFGLYHVNYDTQERTLKESGKLYADYATGTVMPQVVILAGGLGTRLGELSKSIPKSLISVSGKPILSHILEWAAGQGCRRAVILTGHLGEQFEGFKHEGMDLTFVQETEQMGTGSALLNAIDYLEDEFILLWGDDYHPVNYRRLYAAHKEHGQSLTMTVIQSDQLVNLRHENGNVVEYSKSEITDTFNGYEAGTSVVNKSVLVSFGNENLELGGNSVSTIVRKNTRTY